MRGPTHRDTDANVYTQTDDHTHTDAHAVPQCLSAAYHEVNVEDFAVGAKRSIIIAG